MDTRARQEVNTGGKTQSLTTTVRKQPRTRRHRCEQRSRAGMLYKVINYMQDEHQAQWTQELGQEVNTGGQVVVGQTGSMHTPRPTQELWKEVTPGGHAIPRQTTR